MLLSGVKKRPVGVCCSCWGATSTAVVHVIKATRLDEILAIYPTVDEALTALKRPMASRPLSAGLVDMGEPAGSLVHDDLQHAFKSVLKHVLRHGELPPTCLAFDLSVVQAVGDVARAARDNSPTNQWITEACPAFAKSAAEQPYGSKSLL